MNVLGTGQWVAISCGILILTACSAKQPVFYPNDHLHSVGKTQARTDVDRCMAEAKEYGVKNDAGKTVGGRKRSNPRCGHQCRGLSRFRRQCGPGRRSRGRRGRHGWCGERRIRC